MGTKTTCFVIESGHADTVVQLSGRLLAYAALDHAIRVLFRLSGTVWTTTPDQWPQPQQNTLQWLKSQEFESAHAYWRMALQTVNPELFRCSSSDAIYGAEDKTLQFEEGSLVRFLLDAEAEGANVIWM